MSWPELPSPRAKGSASSIERCRLANIALVPRESTGGHEGAQAHGRGRPVAPRQCSPHPKAALAVEPAGVPELEQRATQAQQAIDIALPVEPG